MPNLSTRTIATSMATDGWFYATDNSFSNEFRIERSDIFGQDLTPFSDVIFTEVKILDSANTTSSILNVTASSVLQTNTDFTVNGDTIVEGDTYPRGYFEQKYEPASSTFGANFQIETTNNLSGIARFMGGGIGTFAARVEIRREGTENKIVGLRIINNAYDAGLDIVMPASSDVVNFDMIGFGTAMSFTGLNAEFNGKVGIGVPNDSSFILRGNGAAIFGDGFDGTNYGKALQTVRPSTGSVHLAIVKSGSFVWGLGYVYNTNNFGIFSSPSTTDSSNTDASLTIDTPGNVIIGSSSTPTGTSTKALIFGDNAGDPTPGTNTAGIFAKDVSGTVEMFAVNENGVIHPMTGSGASGSYTPTFTNISNTDSTAVAFENNFYQVIGNIVSVTGAVVFDLTASVTTFGFAISLPIASNLTNTFDLVGVATCWDGTSAVNRTPISLVGITSSNTAGFGAQGLNTATTGGMVVSYEFKYEIK